MKINNLKRKMRFARIRYFRIINALRKEHVLTDDFLMKLSRLKSDREIVRCWKQEIEKEQKSDLELELLQNQTTVIMLQSQINPHFLYNTLDCIRGEAILLGADDLANMTKALSNFFSYSIRRTGVLVTVSEELENIENYFLIQQFRFNQRFHLDIECDRQDAVIMENIIPRLTLQPILENAISHGFGNMIGNCRIKVCIFKTDDSIRIRCSDNGCGMSPEKLDEILRILESGEITGSKSDEKNQEIHGLGLANINNRIRLLIGSEYGLYVSSMEGAGTDVEIRLPIQNKVVER